jgi:hypothetical protein
MNILMPLTITSAMLSSSTLAEPAASETAWVSAGTYVAGDKRIRTGTHRVYNCILGHTGRTAYPEDDTTYWEDYDPTLKWAPFDSYVSTPASLASPLTYVMLPGFFDAISMYGLTGTGVTITHKATAGGTVLETRTISLYAESLGMYEYLFGPKNPKSKIVETGFALRPASEVTISVTGTGTVSLGMCNIGSYRSLVSDWGGTQYGASVEPVTTSRITTDATTGKVTIKRGNAATGLRASVALPLADANYALQSVQEVLDVPVSWIATGATGYEGLNVFGLGSANLSYAGPDLVQLNINVKGMI